MSLVMVTRHKGTIEYLKSQGLEPTVEFMHLTGPDLDNIDPGSIIVGVLPINLAVLAVNMGHRVILVQLALTQEDRGRELSMDELKDKISLVELQLVWTDPFNVLHTEPDYKPCTGDVPKIGLVHREINEIKGQLTQAH